MKKIYISPESIVVRLMSSAILATSGHDEVGDGNQLTKENVNNFGSSTGGGKSIWDEEW
ncbi:MAG: hypothetical protein IKU02_08960 [Bacteroidaceae bacterium]|nr:hypothetical protein [Bacteroidaceae bacterium]